jgi:two-component system, cell cycle response regulator DivK
MASRKVLVVDDVDEQRDITSTLLRHHGYEVLEAAGGTEAVRLSRENRPDLVILDMVMSTPDGWTVTDMLKHDPLTSRIPIIALTVSHAAEDQERAREAGADSYLIKPCFPATVLEEVQRWIGPAE